MLTVWICRYSKTKKLHLNLLSSFSLSLSLRFNCDKNSFFNVFWQVFLVSKTMLNIWTKIKSTNTLIRSNQVVTNNQFMASLQIHNSCRYVVKWTLNSCSSTQLLRIFDTQSLPISMLWFTNKKKKTLFIAST